MGVDGKNGRPIGRLEGEPHQNQTSADQLSHLEHQLRETIWKASPVPRLVVRFSKVVFGALNEISKAGRVEVIGLSVRK